MKARTTKPRTRPASDIKDHRREIVHDSLAMLRAEFDRELAHLRAPEAGGELLRLFDATPDEVAHAANAASSKPS